MIHTSRVVDGYCYILVFFKNQRARMAFGIWYFVSFYVVILVIFVFCYSRILLVIRRQAHVMTGHATSGSTTALKATQTRFRETAHIAKYCHCCLAYMVAITKKMKKKKKKNKNIAQVSNKIVKSCMWYLSGHYFRGVFANPSEL